MRKLTDTEISQLVGQGCIAEQWSRVEVDDTDFRPERVRQVNFLGNVAIGGMSGSVEMEDGFSRPACIEQATLHNVTIGNDCVVSHVSGYISNMEIGDGSLVQAIGVMSAQGTPTFGQGTEVAVLNEGGEPNVVLYDRLTAQTAALMLRCPALRRLVSEELAARPLREQGVVGRGARIVGVREMQNVCVGDSCELQGASRLSECTILGADGTGALIGPDVILENCIVQEGATVTDGARLYNTLVGEATRVGRGYTAESCLLFANGHFENGEACATFCGPFCATHHKGSLLIGGLFSFYNAGSATNQSNHAYKMGPIHWGTLARGSKTASGAHLVWPATIGPFSMVMGKVDTHPDLRDLPFSYVIGQNRRTIVVPGLNLRTVGTWRDVAKWPRRDRRPRSARHDLICMAFPNPLVAQAARRGQVLLQRLLDEQPASEWLEGPGYTVKREAAVNGLQYYDLLLRLFIRETLNTMPDPDTLEGTGVDEWTDLGGMLAPQREVQSVADDIERGAIASSDELALVLAQMHDDYRLHAAEYAHALMQQLGGSMFADQDYWLSQAEEAHERWLRMVRDDAEAEYQLGDVDEDYLRDFLDKIK